MWKIYTSEFKKKSVEEEIEKKGDNCTIISFNITFKNINGYPEYNRMVFKVN